ncbi:cadmium-translocating P-type ATPase [Conexibacter sp. W3-3-2]|uniref:heavy metal translocating P-type ATPase n=1 Tax=Conexibacter sp. W3-3-2 TaxID=2675227 RepID=UPI0012B92F1B|nr:cation-translocating P-type ATPase [Conexibacter sp. W3-3-2]MTD46328.1 cadmium-translocating P-type ATPase [Conexibacter sp. W3-3-2]
MTSLPMAPPSASPAVEEDAQDARHFIVDGMDCASCARTVEQVVAGLDGVETVRVSFGNSTLVLRGDVANDTVAAAVRRAGYVAHVPGAVRGPQAPFWRRNRRTMSTTASVALLLVAVALSLLGANDAVADGAFLASMAAGGWPIALAATAALRRRVLDMNVLMTMAAAGAVAIGDFAEAAWVLVLFAIGTTLETFALDRSRRAVEGLMDLAPPEARVVTDDGDELVPVDDVAIGASVLVRPGERLPLDGTVVDGRSSVDESALTGESVPVDKEPGDKVFAGTLNAQGALTVHVTTSAAGSTLARIAELVADAQGSQAPAERFVDRFARYYTPLVFLAAVLLAIVPTAAGGDFDTWLYRSLALLIVACPCALVISVPVSVVSAIGGAARRGVLIKGGQALEDLGRVSVVALDKTGTLTKGRPEVASIVPVNGLTEEAVLRLMASIERSSEHPLAAAILRAAEIRSIRPLATSDFEAVPGRGAHAHVEGRALWAGGPRMAADHAAALPASFDEAEQRGETAVMLGEGDTVLAVFGLADELRPEAPAAIVRLRSAGVARIVMLTGDSERVARAVAQRTGIGEWRAGLLPEDKLEAIRSLGTGQAIAMVGDGVNDAPALAGATVGVAMGAAGSDIALESADVALMGDELERLPEAIEHSRRAVRIMRQNVVVSLATKAVFVVLAPLGFVSLIAAVAVDMGVSLLVTLNGVRLLQTRRQDPVVAAEPAASGCSDGCCSDGPDA